MLLSYAMSALIRVGSRLGARGVCSLVVALFAGSVAAAPAHAEAPVLGAGSVITSSPYPNFDGHCMLAAVGYDAQGRALALTAGHCGPIGSAVLTADGSAKVGSVVTRRVFPGIGAFESNYLDYAFVRLRPGVKLGDVAGVPATIRRIQPPHPGEILCKFGSGLGVGGERCGITGRITPGEFDNFLLASFGDSGGPVYAEHTDLVGIVSRPATIPYLGSVTMTRADAAVADAAANGWIGGSFVPVA